MLFLYDRPPTAVMWMKNTIIPLDMVFIARGRQRCIGSRAMPSPFPPIVISSEGVVVGVLELNAGQADNGSGSSAATRSSIRDSASSASVRPRPESRGEPAVRRKPES